MSYYAISIFLSCSTWYVYICESVQILNLNKMLQLVKRIESIILAENPLLSTLFTCPVQGNNYFCLMHANINSVYLAARSPLLRLSLLISNVYVCQDMEGLEEEYFMCHDNEYFEK